MTTGLPHPGHIMALVCVLLLLWVPPVGAATGPAALCEAAAARAAAETGVPEAVLHAIALTETGRSMGGTMRPWPWTLNQAGRGAWLETRAGALERIGAILASGAGNVDIGCFQINHHWHGAAFASLDAMIDPDTNARYAARLLARLHAETGDWTAAAGAYHSRRPGDAARYAARFAAHLAVLPAPDPAPPRLVQVRANAYPLLQPGSMATPGSLYAAPPQPARALIATGSRPLIGGG